MLPPRPLISVTLPNYNYGRFLAQALESILTQTYENLEILLTEDGSTDDSRAIAERYARQDRRIKPVYFASNQGALVAHADTWQRVRGEIIYQFSSDDYLVDPDFFRFGVEALAQHPQAAGFYGAADVIVIETGLSRVVMGWGEPAGFIAPFPFLKGFLSGRFFVPGISSLWRKSGIDAVGGYDTQLGPQTDYFINHALPARSGAVFMPKIFAHARDSAARKSFSSSATLEDEMRRLALFAAKLRDLTRHSGDLETDWSNWRRGQAAQLVQKFGRATLAAGPILSAGPQARGTALDGPRAVR